MEDPIDPKTDPEPEPKNPEAPKSPPVEQAPPKAPPAAQIVLKGLKNEKDVALERTLKERETRIAELEDENRTLKTPPTPAPTPTPAKKKSWLKGWTFLDADSEE
jgi:hypothetical protein